MPLESIRPRGTFHARATRDAEALRRDGQTFVLSRELAGTDPRGGQVFEVMFEDGVWMLATVLDLTADGSPDTEIDSRE